MYVAVMGYGTVGSGVVEVFNKNHESIVKRSTQSALEIRYILDLRDFRAIRMRINSLRILTLF